MFWQASRLVSGFSADVISREPMAYKIYEGRPPALLQKQGAESLLRRRFCDLRVFEVASSGQDKRRTRRLRCCARRRRRSALITSFCGTRNRQRTAAGQQVGSARSKQGMWLVGAASFRRALGPWGPGGRARRRRRSARRRRRSARSAALSGHLRSRNGLRSGCTPGTEGASKTLKSLLIDGVTGGAPASEKCDCRLC